MQWLWWPCVTLWAACWVDQPGARSGAVDPGGWAKQFVPQWILGSVLRVPVAIDMAASGDENRRCAVGAACRRGPRPWVRVEASSTSLAQGCCREWSVRGRRLA